MFGGTCLSHGHGFSNASLNTKLKHRSPFIPTEHSIDIGDQNDLISYEIGQIYFLRWPLTQWQQPHLHCAEGVQ